MPGGIIYPKPEPVGLLIITPPTRTEYIVGETFNPAGMDVRMLMSDGSKIKMTSYSWEPSGPLGLSDGSIAITSGGKTAYQNISVVSERQAVGLVIAKNPSKTVYKAGETFSRYGMTVKVRYSTGTYEPITDYECYPNRALTTDDTFVEVRHSNLSAIVRIKVDANADCKCTDADKCGHECCEDVHEFVPSEGEEYIVKPTLPYKIMVRKRPTKSEYFEGEYFDKTGMKVIRYYQNNIKPDEIITDYEIRDNKPLNADCREIEIVYDGHSTKLGIIVRPRISKDVPPAAEDFDVTGGVKGRLRLGTGKASFGFDDLGLSGTLPFAVSHIYEKGGKDSSCGKNWKLNLHQTLKTSPYSGGVGYELSEDIIPAKDAEYIYTDARGDRYGFNGIYYYRNAENKKIFVNDSEVSVDAGGRLTLKDDGRSVEREFVTVSGLKLTTELVGVLGAEKFEQRADEMVRLSDEIEQYKDIINETEFACKQDEVLYGAAGMAPSYVTQKVDWNVNAYYSLRERINAVQDAINEIKGDAAETSTQLEALEKYLSELQKSYSDGIKDGTTQRNDYLRLQNVRRRERYKNILAQKQELLNRYKSSIPVSYLTDSDGISLCFNEYGKLCGIMDGYNNCVIVEWQTKPDGTEPEKIARVYDDNHGVTFKYGADGRIESMSDEFGGTVKYEYSDGQLTGVKRSDGRSLSFTYNCNGYVTIIESPATAEKAEITYGEQKFIGMTVKSCLGALSDNRTAAEEYSPISETSVRYADSRTDVTVNGNSTAYYLGYHGGIRAKVGRDANGKILSGASFEFESADKTWGYAVREGRPLWESEELKMPGTSAVYTVKKSLLPQGATEFAFSAEANLPDGTEMTDTGMRFDLPFKTSGETTDSDYSVRAVVKYADKSVTFKASLDCRNSRAQYISLPVHIDADNEDNLLGIELFLDCTALAGFDNLHFAPAEWEYYEYDDGRDMTEKRTSDVLFAPDAYRSTQTHYAYDGNHRLVCETATVTESGSVNAQRHIVKRYGYCEHGNLVREESFVEEDKNEKGVNITERICDDKGNIIKEFSYNSLDSSSKFYKESERTEDGTVKADVDETGENKTSYEYENGKVKTRILPNGGKLSYGWDENGNVTAITQSTDDGEGNSTEIKYTFGSPARLKSGNNTACYEYDKKRRKTKVTLNGREINYTYSGSKFDTTESVNSESKTIGDTAFNAVKADKTTAAADKVTAETYTDKRGNTVMTKICETDGEYEKTSVTAYNYNENGKITASGDSATNSVIKYTYGDDALEELQSVEITAGSDVEALTENYFRNAYGKISGRTVTGAVNHNYAYFYKDNAERDLEYIALPNALKYYPQTDVNGRHTGKELKDENGIVYSEYICYRKVGDRATGMPSSIYYGKNKNNRYAITDNVKYKYDESGNISEVKENGLLSVKYSYDKIGRLIREDNRKLNKTVLLSYDNCGNILSKRETPYTLKPEEEITEFTDEKLYAYDGDRLIAFGNETVHYGSGVNPEIYRGNSLSWDYGKQLKSYGENTFAYDGYGRRIRKNDTVYTYDVNNKLVKQTDGKDTLEFVYDNGGLSGVKHNETEYIYAKDVQGNIRALLDKSGREVVQYTYDGWGNCRTTVIDEESAQTAELNPFRYRSYYYDTETHLYNLKTRYYDPETGRFVSQDDVSYLDPEHINGLNLFAYCGNNPVMNVDPNGTVFVTIFLIFASIALGALVGGLCNGIAAASTGGDFVSGFVGGLVSGAVITVGMALAFATGGVGGLAVAALFGFAASFTGSIVQQSLDPNKTEISFLSALASGIVGMVFGAIGYGVSMFIMQSTVGLFDAVLDMTSSFASRFVAALSMSLGSFLLTVTFSASISFIQSVVDALINLIIKKKEKEKIKKLVRRPV